MSKTKVSQETVRRSARSAGLLGAALLGLGLLAVPGSAGANRVTLGREHIAGAVARAAGHEAWVRAGMPGRDCRAQRRGAEGNGLHGVALRPEAMYELFPALGRARAGGDKAPPPGGTNADAFQAGIDAALKLAPGVLDQAQRLLAYHLGDWGVEWRGSPGPDGTPGALLRGGDRDRANWAGAGFVIDQMDKGKLADWVLRAVQEQARRSESSPPADWASVMVLPNGVARPVSEAVAREVMFVPLGGLRELRTQGSSVTDAGVSQRALSVLLPDSAEIRQSRRPAPSAHNGLVIQGTNYVPVSDGYTDRDARHFREHD